MAQIAVVLQSIVSEGLVQGPYTVTVSDMEKIT